MFTWMCPQCGREVPPSYSECPDCAKRAAAPPPDQQAAPPPQQQYAPPPPPQRQYAPPPPPQPQQPPYASIPSAHPQYQQQYAPPQYGQPQYGQPQYGQPPQYMPPPPRAGLPTWAMALLFSVAICGVVFGIYWLVGSNKGGATPSAAVENPAAKAGAKTSPYQKFIEIAGVRFVEDPRKKTTQVRFVLINHSNADISGLSGNVTVWGRTRTSEEDAEGSFTFTSDVKAYETKDITVPLNTKKKIYELPDWQNVSTDIQITAPQ